jgi:hypothetical protein
MIGFTPLQSFTAESAEVAEKGKEDCFSFVFSVPSVVSALA